MGKVPWRTRGEPPSVPPGGGPGGGPGGLRIRAPPGPPTRLWLWCSCGQLHPAVLTPMALGPACVLEGQPASHNYPFQNFPWGPPPPKTCGLGVATLRWLQVHFSKELAPQTHHMLTDSSARCFVPTGMEAPPFPGCVCVVPGQTSCPNPQHVHHQE